MANIKKLSYEELDKGIKPEEIKIGLIIAKAFIGGIISFAAVCFIIYFSTLAKVDLPPSDTSAIEMIFIVMMSISAVLYLIVRFFSNKLLDFAIKSYKNNFSSNFNEYTPNQFAGIVKTFNLMRFAILEGAALSGLVTFFNSITYNIIFFDPIYWFSLTPALLTVLFISVNLPVKEKVIQIIQDNIYPKL